MNDPILRGLQACVYPLLLWTIWLLITPFASAADLEWEHLVERSNSIHIIGLAFTAGITLKQLHQIIRNYNGRGQLATDRLPKTPHQNDQPFDEYIRDFLKSPFTTYDFLPEETIRAYVQRCLKADEWIVPNNITLTRTQRQGAARRVLAALERFYESLQYGEEITRNLEEEKQGWANALGLSLQDIISNDRLTNLQKFLSPLETVLPKIYHQQQPNPSLWASGIEDALLQADKAADKVRNQLADVASELQKWEQNTKVLNKGNIISADMAGPLIEALLRTANLDPFRTLVPPSQLKATNDPVNLAAQIATIIREHLSNVWKALPAKYQGGDTFTDTTQLLQGIEKLKKGLHRMTAGMSITPTGSGQLSLSIAEIWSALPTNFTDGKIIPGTPDDMKDFLTTMDISATPQPTGLGATCNHPRELALRLQDPETQSWATSLVHVMRLLDNQIPAGGIPPATAAPRNDHLFSARDVPEFTDAKEYWSWRSAFRRFTNSVRVATDEVPLALNRVLSRFTGSLADAGNRWNINDLVLGLDWQNALAIFISQLDEQFLDETFLREQGRLWRAVRPGNRTLQEFRLEFQTRVLNYNEAAHIAGTLPIEEAEITRQWISIIPNDVRNALYAHHTPEAMTVDELINRTIRLWSVAHTPANKNTGTKATSNSNTPAPTSNSTPPASGSRQPPPSIGWGTCNTPCWDASPAIPQGNRGSFRDPQGNIKRGNHDKCPRCRRPESDHGGRPSGCQGQGQHSWHQNKIPALASGTQISGNAPADEV